MKLHVLMKYFLINVFQHAFAKFVGICNDIDRVLNVCLSGEREQNRQANKQKSQAMKDKLYANQKQNQNQCDLIEKTIRI